MTGRYEVAKSCRDMGGSDRDMGGYVWELGKLWKRTVNSGKMDGQARELGG